MMKFEGIAIKDPKTTERVKLIIEKLKPAIDEGNFDFVCSGLISCGAIKALMEIAANCDDELRVIMSDKRIMKGWHSYRGVIEYLFNSIPWMTTTDMNMIFNYDIIKTKGLGKLPKDICNDMSIFCQYAVWVGSVPSDARKYINNKTQKQIQRILNTEGVRGIFTRLYRSCAAFLAIDDKLIAPELERLKTQNRCLKIEDAIPVAKPKPRADVPNQTGFGTMAAALNDARKTKRSR